MQTVRFWTAPKKVIITILAAVVWTRVFGCLEPPPPAPAANTSLKHVVYKDDSSVQIAQAIYGEYNTKYFFGKLPARIAITMNDRDSQSMADSGCDDTGTDCVIDLNPFYVTAPRTLRGTLVHEMCHIRVWTKTLAKDMPAGADKIEYDHGKDWRTCMLAVDDMGAFREINIDYYHEK